MKDATLQMQQQDQEIKSALWAAANTLRGSAVDRTDWKGYILPLLFFKRISDVRDEEMTEAQEIYGEVDPSLFPEIHRFVVPEGCHWEDVRAVPTNVGAALLRAMQEIERANPDTLYRVFGSADWGNKEKFTDELLKDMIEGFSEIQLGNTAVSTDVLGDAYEYLVGKFADVTRRNKAGEFYTPRSVVRMMVEILDPQGGESIYDPACGTGGMLLGAIEHVTRKGGDPRNSLARYMVRKRTSLRPPSRG
jgi:type I restriction enzyme M protein